MYDEQLNPPTLMGSESAAELIKSWLLDEKDAQSGLLGVNDVLQVVSVRTFQHGLTQPELSMALGDAIRAEATGVVAYGVANEAERPSFNAALIGSFVRACESLNVTLLDVIIYSRAASRCWISARQRNML